MRMSDLIETARSMNQAYRPKAEKDPVQVIDRDTANAFNKLLDESKKKFPENPFVKKMKPVDSSRTQLAGLLSKVDLLQDCLKTEESRVLSSLAESD